MADSEIGWTDKTWNPTTGCTRVSPGCKNCYAAVMHKRLQAMGQKKYQKPFEEFREWPDEIFRPLSWKKPSRIFVNSMSDLHHIYASYDFLEEIYDTMIKADWHQFQILTKRPDNMAEFLSWYLQKKGLEVLPKHIWVGTSVENQETTFRIRELLYCDAIVRFISFEPLLERIVLSDLIGISWIIIGGESGVNARPMEKDWVERLIYLAENEGARVFFKQWGGRYSGGDNTINGRKYEEYPVV